jgi:hypothetical protein
MDHAQKVLNVREAKAEELLPFMRQAARYGLGDASDDDACILKNGAGYIIEVDGVPRVGYVLQEVRGGLFITTAAGGQSGIDFTTVGLAIIERQAEGFEAVGFRTIRRGLVRKTSRLGYQVHARVGNAYVMRKKLT